MSQEPDDWFAAAGPRAEALRRVDALVMAAAPGIDRRPAGGMLGYGFMPYRPRSVTETTTVPLVSLAAQSTSLDRVDVVELDRLVRDAVRAHRDGTNAAGRP